MHNSKKNSLYQKIYEQLKQQISQGVFKGGERLPYEREICASYGVDRVTVRHALDLLVKDGLIEKRPGVGSFVKSSPRQKGPIPGKNNILFVMSRNTNDIICNPSAYNSELFYAIENECRKHDYTLIYSTLEQGASPESIAYAEEYLCILLVSYFPDKLLQQFADRGLPAICLNHYHERILSILPDDRAGAAKATEFLIEHGHRRIGILKGRAGYYSTQERFQGYREALMDAGIQPDDNYILECDWTFDGARAAVSNMLEEASPPEALFCSNDMMAVGAMDAIREHGLRIPEDISIVGFDNVAYSRYVSPRLTTVSVQKHTMAEIAVDSAMKIHSGGSLAPVRITIPVSLEIRQSVR